MKKLFLIPLLVIAMIALASCSQTVTSQFTDETLGLSFEYPAEWGEAEWLDGDIVFSNQSEIKLIMAQHTSDETANEKCLSNWSSIGRNDMNNEDGADVYVEKGSYQIGFCEGDFPYSNVATVDRDSSNEWVPLDEDIEGSSEITLTRNHYFDLETPYYPRMTISISLPSINSQETCLMRVASKCDIEEEETEITTENDEEVTAVAPGEPSLECPLYQNLKCTNYAEGEMIEDAFENLDNSDFGEEVEDLLESMVIEPVENAEELFAASYNANYEELTDYSNEDLGISFTYPVAFGEIEANDSNTSISADGFSITVSTLEDAIADEAAYLLTCAEAEAAHTMPPCGGRVLTEAKWQSNYDALQNDDGGNENIVQFGENKFLLSPDGRCGDSVTEAKYITFIDDIRFEIRGNTVKNVEQFTWMSPYELKTYQLRTDLIESIIATMEFF